MRRLAPLLLPAALFAQDLAPPPVTVLAPLPGGGSARVRLQFKAGVSAEGQDLPRGFLGKDAAKRDWVDFRDLSTDGKRWALVALFPKDRWEADRATHVVAYPALESVWLMSALFTGHGQNYDKLMAANPGLPEKLTAGDAWIIPPELLLKELGGQGSGHPDRSQPEDQLDDEARTNAYRTLLTFERDDQGAYAAYHMRKSEALYSSVVLRYTDRIDPKDVNELALAIAKRSGISDIRGIQPGQLVKIPLDALADPFQPEGTKALAEEQEVRAEVRRTARVDAGPRLKGVRIVLDAGHGGVDKGAMANGLWESDFVYDITMRVYRLLQEETDASVSSTIRYPGIGFDARDRIRRASSDAEILTTPPFANDGESPNATSVHLRWVLANDLFQKFQAQKGDPRKTLFISFHADSLHPSARGTMVYVPGATLVPSRFYLSPMRTGGVKEARTASMVRFSGKEKLMGEARSRQFAEALLRALADEDVPVHTDRGIRNVIHRDGGSWLPAVIRYNEAATKVLIETANLTNPGDARNLEDPAFRQRFAEGVVDAVKAYFGK
ncbi:MAG TPA: N-acetylmuramoyl-L-alanine amidase [Holophagaceae bacterium]|nr:N-acetylmuramoyl-L-alanine amidase [Holophagaceae bacterium]